MAFSFGSQSAAQGPNSTTLFGTSTSFNFGNNASNTSLFGGNQFQFGASSAAQSTSLFGNPQSSVSMFGTSQSSTSLFGNSQTYSSLFGNPQSSAALFGSAQSSTSLFGSSSPSLFGNSTSALFSNPSNNTSSSSLFGANSSSFMLNSSSASLYGGTSNNQIVPFGSNGLQSQSTENSFTSGLGNPADSSASKELEAIACAYNPNSPKYRFKVRPSDVDELQWRAALLRASSFENPEELWPVLAVGFKDLIKRKSDQDLAIKECAKRLSDAQTSTRTLERKQHLLIFERISAIRRKHLELSHKLLCIIWKVDVLESRLANTQEMNNGSYTRTIADLTAKLSKLNSIMQSPNMRALQQKVETAHAFAKVRDNSNTLKANYPILDDNSLSKIYNAMVQQTEAIEKLQSLIRKHSRDLSILQKRESNIF